ncbi:MAG: hypothetical protein HWE11_07010 [Gammaproteobacteria bacterium]|nr:hypothetical protein [Gammaproteobacteria bacterium]
MVIAAHSVIAIVGIYLLLLGISSLIFPRATAAFLEAFASSAKAHFLELSIRLVAGVALILGAPGLLLSKYVAGFGWLIVSTSILLMVLPWRWHQAFAQRMVPPLTKRVWVFSLLSLPLGLALLVLLLQSYR